jgi:uncharacterized membrane protein YjjP (DUF1212 family)
MRRAKLEGRHIGRRPLEVDCSAVVRDRQRGMSLSTVAKLHRISQALVSKILREAKEASSRDGFLPSGLQDVENRPPLPAA